MALTDQAIAKIKEMIQTGELNPGDRLPPEHELTERLGMSRSSLREGIKALESMRILNVRRGDGTYVTSLKPSLLLEAMSFVLDFNADKSVMKVFETRRLLEPLVAGLAAERASEDAKTKMHKHLLAISPAASTDELVAHDLKFHSMIAESTGNEYLASLIETIGSHTWRARVWRGVTEGNAIERTFGEHERILEAIQQQDKEVAEATMLLHVCGVEKWLSAELENNKR